MRNISILLLYLGLFSAGCGRPGTLVPAKVCPEPEQVVYQEMELVGFIHFGMNTFTNREWGFGDEDPALFNPVGLDAGQWARAAKEAGMGELILTAKHHDGFCLWPSSYTDHCIKNSPYKNGNGDIVREFVEACRREGLKVGIYLSPWDRNHPDYGTPAYITYYRNQLRELLTAYGEINEIWFDGANGGTGYYGGAREERRIDRTSYYDWPGTFALVKELQPGIRIFSDAGPDIRWVGNENGFAGETFWSTIDPSRLVIGGSDPTYLNTGDPEGTKWIIGQCDVSIRPGWFYHPAEDSLVKSSGRLFDIYLKSVGRNAVLLLNLPPDTNGLLPAGDVKVLKEFGELVDQAFAINLARNRKARVSTLQGRSRETTVMTLTDGDRSTFWSGREGEKYSIRIETNSSETVDCIVLSEPIAFGQGIEAFRVMAMDSDGSMTEIAAGTTIGYKRILSFPPVQSAALCVLVDSARAQPALSEISLYHISREEN
ncbi:MAG: alpha-L-fucosidase [Bacteroidota bacterium]